MDPARTPGQYATTILGENRCIDGPLEAINCEIFSSNIHTEATDESESHTTAGFGFEGGTVDMASRVDVPSMPYYEAMAGFDVYDWHNSLSTFDVNRNISIDIWKSRLMAHYFGVTAWNSGFLPHEGNGV